MPRAPADLPVCGFFIRARNGVAKLTWHGRNDTGYSTYFRKKGSAMTPYGILRSENPMMAKKKVIALCQNYSFGEVAKMLCMSRTTVWNIYTRFKYCGEVGLIDRSHRPKKPCGKTHPELERIVIEERMRTGFGPHKIARHLSRERNVVVAVGTIRNILHRNGFSRKRTSKEITPSRGVSSA